MIHYQLRCAAGHGFEGWFRDSTGFEKQAAAGLLSCPQCGDARVDRALMAPAVRTRQARAQEREAEASASVAVATPAARSRDDAARKPPALPDAVRAALQRLRAEVERHCDDVGDAFVEEARRMHYGEQPARGIFGNATEDEREALADEGIEVARVPWIGRAES